MVMGGLCLFFVGLLVLSTMSLFESPDYDDYEYEEREKYDEDTEAHEDLMRNMYSFGKIFIVIGGLINSMALIGSGVGNTDQDSKVRGVSISAGIAFVVSVLVVLYIFSVIPLY